jgi:deoxyribodipyrimidine photolyase-related protein
VQSTEVNSDIRNLTTFLAEKGYEKIIIIDPVDNWLQRRISTKCIDYSIELEVLDSPMFLNSKENLSTFFKPDKKKFFQTEFYIQERKKREILVDSNKNPIGGQWSFDAENRKKYPKTKIVPSIEFPSENAFVLEAKKYVSAHFNTNIGENKSVNNYPTTFEESENWLEQFFQKRFNEFGDFEDAIVTKESILNHGVLTPMLNVGLLTPQQIIDACLDFSQKNDTPLNSTEGFLRQIIGWREFIRGIYEVKGTAERNRNFWNFTRKIPSSFYDGTTGIYPVDQTIKKILKTGYCHHIERLMVLGNFMLLCEFDPDEVYRWFMEMFIDAYDWVMVPNIYGMSQFADGGLMSTKPYISGSNYLNKMSDYPKGEWQETWDALFWHFMDKQRDFFLKNPRLSMLVKSFDKMEISKKEPLILKAKQFLKNL